MEREKLMKKIGIVMGSKSDLPIVEKAIKVIKEFSVPFEVHVLSAHRCPDEAREFANKARENNFGVLIGAAGMSAHLAGALAANTTLPVIGLPLRSGASDGLDALYSTINMPPNIPVATVGIDAGKNAGLLAIQILAVNEDELAQKLKELKEKDKEKVLLADKEVSAMY